MQAERTESEAFADGCAAIMEITAGRESIEACESRLLEEWWTESGERIEEVLRRREEAPFRVRRQLSFLYAERSAGEAHETHSAEALQTSIRALIDGLAIISYDHGEPEDTADAALVAALLLCDGIKHPVRKSLSTRAQRDGVSQEDDHPRLVEALGIDLEAFRACVGRIGAARKAAAVEGRDFQPTPAAAADLVVGGDWPAAGVVPLPSYDKSDAERRVRSIELEGFRGSPTRIEVDFVHRSRCVSAIVLGDNGVGKSTLVDAIEFGLQGRLGRSVNFDSPLRPAGVSFAAADVTRLVVRLDDESVETRSLVKRDDGKIVADRGDVRPGFRLAPVTLKRQDILRFLDTESLARGHVFFDYFPSQSRTMAVRPEEKLERLDDEEYELRVGQAALTERLGGFAGVDVGGLRDRRSITDLVKDRFTGGKPIDVAHRDGTWEKLDPALASTVESLLGAMNRLSKIKKERERGIETLNPVAYRSQAALIGHILDGVGEGLTDSFRTISGAEHVRRIDVVFGRSGPVALDIVIELSTGERCFPQQIFSEGYRDLLAILFFVEVAAKAADHGQARVLILDDVFQSVDAAVRVTTVDHILRRFPDWQLIFTVHDRLWFEQLRATFRRRGHPFVERELRCWKFETGPTISTTAPSFLSSLERELESGEPAGICSASGRLMEQACDQLSWRIGASVTRRKDDKYTLGDLWPSVRKRLKDSTVGPTCDALDSVISLRNLAGAHYNEWAESLSLAEAERFGHAVLSFVGATWCAECHDWVATTGASTGCGGGHLVL